MRSLKRHDKVCLNCKKEYQAQRTDSKYCSASCKAIAGNIRKGAGEIIAEAKIAWVEELKSKYSSVHVSMRYKKLVAELAGLRGKGTEWVQMTINTHRAFLIEDTHHGYTEAIAIEDIKELIEYYKSTGVKAPKIKH